MNGGLYRGSKPVMWSVVEKTALAEAEIEYHDHTSTTIWVSFPCDSVAGRNSPARRVVIWTTTPWTIPGNRAVAYGADDRLRLVEVTRSSDGAGAKAGERLVVAEALEDQVAETARHHRLTRRWRGQGRRRSPARSRSIRCAGTPAATTSTCRCCAGDFVTTEAGTGFVHIAPGHGDDDFELGLAQRRRGAADRGPRTARYYAHVPLFAGQAVYTRRRQGGRRQRAR